MLQDVWFDSGYMHCRIWKKYRHFLDYLGDDFLPLVSAGLPVFGVYVWSDSGYAHASVPEVFGHFFLYFLRKNGPRILRAPLRDYFLSLSEKSERCDCGKNAPALRRHSQKRLLRQQRRRGVTASSCCREQLKPSSSPAALAPENSASSSFFLRALKEETIENFLSGSGAQTQRSVSHRHQTHVSDDRRFICILLLFSEFHYLRSRPRLVHKPFSAYTEPCSCNSCGDIFWAA